MSTNIKNMTLIKYLLQAVNNGYLEKIVIKQFNDYDIPITVYVDDIENIGMAYNMIEANVYVNSELLATSIEFRDETLIIKTANNITYRIRVKSKRNSRKNKNRRTYNKG